MDFQILGNGIEIQFRGTLILIPADFLVSIGEGLYKVIGIARKESGDLRTRNTTFAALGTAQAIIWTAVDICLICEVLRHPEPFPELPPTPLPKIIYLWASEIAAVMCYKPKKTAAKKNAA